MNTKDTNYKQSSNNYEKILLIQIKRNNSISVQDERFVSRVHFFFCFVDVCQEKNTIEDNLRAKFEHEIKIKLDDLRRTLEKDHNEKIVQYQNTFEQDNRVLKLKYQQDSEQQAKELKQDIERSKINQEKMINELNIELDRLRANGRFIRQEE